MTHASSRYLMSLAARTAFFLSVLLATLLSGVAHSEEITVYTALEDDELAVYRAAFEQAHPEITLNVVRDSTGIITARLLAERDNPQADVVWGTALTSLLLCDQQGMFRGYNPAGIDTIKPAFKDRKHEQAHWVGIKAWMTGFVGNTYEMAALGIEMPQSFADLLKPEYAKHIVMPNPASSGTGYLTVSGVLQLFGEEEGWTYLDKLHANIAQYTHSGSKPAKLAGKGEFPIGISFAYRGFKQKADGEPVVVALPKEGSGWDVEANALVRKPRTKKAAKTFLDWAISEEAMRLYAKVYPIIGAKIDLPLPEGYPADPESQLIDNDFDWAAENRTRILKEWSRRYEGQSGG